MNPKYAYDLAEVGREQELNALADVVVDPSALRDRADDRCKVVVGKDHVGNVLCDVGSGDAHADTDVGVLYRGCVVDSVAGHCGDAAAGAPCVDDFHLMLRLNAGIYGIFRDKVFELLVAVLIYFGAGYRLRFILYDAEGLCDGNGGVLMVAGYHDRADACLHALGNGGGDLRTDRVYHSDKPDKGHVMLKRLRAVIGRG